MHIYLVELITRFKFCKCDGVEPQQRPNKSGFFNNNVSILSFNLESLIILK